MNAQQYFCLSRPAKAISFGLVGFFGNEFAHADNLYVSLAILVRTKAQRPKEPTNNSREQRNDESNNDTENRPQEVW